MYVIYKITTEKDYGYGGWKDSYTEYFDIIAVVSTEKKAKEFVKELSEKEDSKDLVEYDYEYATKW
jgi:hypothetical protein